MFKYCTRISKEHIQKLYYKFIHNDILTVLYYNHLGL